MTRRTQSVLLLCVGASLGTVAEAQVGDQYGGPAILSRSTRPIGSSGGRPIRFRFYGSLGANASGNLIPPITSFEGATFEQSTYGAYAGLGAYGVKSGRRSETSLVYGGTYQYTHSYNYFSGTNQELHLNHSQQLNRRTQMFVGVQGGTTNTALGGFRSTFAQDFTFDPSLPAEEIFDNRYYRVSAQAGFSYRRTARHTFTVSGGGFSVQRHSAALASGNGYSASGETAYALSRRTSIGASFGYQIIEYRRSFGESNVMQWQGYWSRVLSARWRLNLGGGAYRTESVRLRQVAADPLVVALLGQTTTLEVFHNVTNGVMASGALNGSFQKSSVSVGYDRGITPGNGILLTSERSSGFGAYSYTGLRRWNVGASANWTHLKGLLTSYQNLGGYTMYGVGGGVSYRMSNLLNFMARYDIQHYKVDGGPLKVTRYQATIGMAFSPGETPLVLW